MDPSMQLCSSKGLEKTFEISLKRIFIFSSGRRPQFRLLAKNIHKTMRTDTDRVRYDWLLLVIKY